MGSGKMESLNGQIRDYTAQLSNGHIQKAYRGIMSFMSGLRIYLENKYPRYDTGTLYPGYMDMTYFAFTPQELKDRKMKIAVVYLHEQNRFDVWLGGGNRKVQAEYIELLKHKDIGHYKLSQALPGVDSIIEERIVDQPDFDKTDELRLRIEKNTIEFAGEIISILNS